MMGQYHPDVSDTTYQKTDEEEQATVVTDVTKAYEVLKHPYERALHLLQIYGHAIEEGDTMTDMIDHEFLLNVMELRQNVESAENDPERKILMEQNLDRLVQTTDALKEAFAKEQYASAKKMTAELRYWTRIDEQLREDIDEL
jgi:molecular chaperone HscB